jgi:hypothetical protein
MTYPMPPELLEQLGLELRDETDLTSPEDNDARGWRPRVAPTGELDEPDDRDQPLKAEEPDGR